MHRLSDKQKSIWALIAYTFIGNIMAIWVRILGTHFEVLQQVAMRSLAGGIIGLILFSFNKQIDFKKILELKIKGYPLMILRSVLLISGIILYTNAILITKLANVGLIFGMPTTALLGIIILKEKLTKKKAWLILFSFVGVAIIAIKDVNNLFVWNKGEVMIFISTFFYAGTNIMRKLIPKEINHKEVGSIGALFVAVFAFILSYFLYNDLSAFHTFNSKIGLTIIAAGITFVSLGILGSIGFSKLEAIVANNLLVLEVVFGILIGFIAFGEIPVIRDIIGGIIILISAYLINKEETKTYE